MRVFKRGSITPNKVYRGAQRVLIGSGILSAAVLAIWLWPGDALPNTPQMLALYLTLLLVTVGAGCVALMAACHLAIHEAFSAGFQTGQVAYADPLERAEEAARRGEADPIVRLVT